MASTTPDDVPSKTKTKGLPIKKAKVNEGGAAKVTKTTSSAKSASTGDSKSRKRGAASAPSAADTTGAPATKTKAKTPTTGSASSSALNGKPTTAKARAELFDQHKLKQTQNVVFGMNARDSVVLSFNKTMDFMSDQKRIVETWKPLKEQDKYAAASISLWLQDPDMVVFAPLTIVSMGPSKLIGPNGGYSSGAELNAAFAALSKTSAQCSTFAGSKWAIETLQDLVPAAVTATTSATPTEHKKPAFLPPIDHYIVWVRDNPPESATRRPAIFPMLQGTFASLSNAGLVHNNQIQNDETGKGYLLYTVDGKTSLYPRAWFREMTLEQLRAQTKRFHAIEEHSQAQSDSKANSDAVEIAKDIARVKVELETALVTPALKPVFPDPVPAIPLPVENSIVVAPTAVTVESRIPETTLTQGPVVEITVKTEKVDS